jgi:hypothetical protein
VEIGLVVASEPQAITALTRLRTKKSDVMMGIKQRRSEYRK